jgi:hypothetical protein
MNPLVVEQQELTRSQPTCISIAKFTARSISSSKLLLDESSGRMTIFIIRNKGDIPSCMEGVINDIQKDSLFLYVNCLPIDSTYIYYSLALPNSVRFGPHVHITRNGGS